MKKYTTWLKIASVVQFLTALIHATTLFGSVPPHNETEKQLFTLMDTYKFDFGAGFHPTMGDLMLALSSCFSMLYLLGSLQNWYLLRKKIECEIMQGVITINLVVFGMCFALFATFAFLPPIILSGLVFLLLIFSRLAVTRTNN